VKPGIYFVNSWNNKDAVLISQDGEFLSLTKSDLPKEFNGELFLGEAVEIAQITVIRLATVSLDERARSARERELQMQNASHELQAFIARENERRKHYGVKSL
jgi:hypothetical protein